LPSPRAARRSAANRPNSISRVFSAASSRPNAASRSRRSARNAPEEELEPDFARGVRTEPEAELEHKGRFSEGAEELPDTPDKAVERRFSEGVERSPTSE